jgi:mannan endo-1,4-beta-mannosidase
MSRRVLKSSWLLLMLATCACSAPSRTATPLSAPELQSASALLAYLQGLPESPQHVLSGQHSSYWNADPMDFVEAATAQTGKTVAILGTTLGISGSNQDGVRLSNQWLEAGGIVLLSLWPVDPFTGRSDNDRSIPFANLTAPGNAAYKAWFAYLDGIAAKLKQLHGPVLFRPFVELNGGWFWYGRQPTAQFITLWQQMHDYLVTTKGLTNLLWVYNVNGGQGNYAEYYPGAAYVDVVSMDSYPPSLADEPMYNALLALGKPIIYAEVGPTISDNSKIVPFSADNSRVLALVKRAFPKVVALVIWCQNSGIPKQNGAAALLSDPAVINLNDLAAGR